MKETKELEAAKLKLMEVLKEQKMIQLKINKKENKRKINIRQILDPISHTPISSSSSKVSDSGTNRFLDRNDSNRRSLANINPKQKIANIESNELSLPNVRKYIKPSHISAFKY